MMRFPFAESPFWFGGNGRIKINILIKSRLTSQTLTHSNKQESFLKILASLPLLNVAERKRDVLEVTKPTTRLYLSEEAMQLMVVLRETTNLVCYIYSTDCRHIKKPTRQMPEKNLCNLYTWCYAILLTMWQVRASWRIQAPRYSGRMIWIASVSWKWGWLHLASMAMRSVQRFNFQREGKNWSRLQRQNRLRRSGKIEIWEEVGYEVEQAPLFFYTPGPGNFQQNPQSRVPNHTSVVEQAFYYLRKEPSFSVAIENVDYDAPGEQSSMHPG